MIFIKKCVWLLVDNGEKITTLVFKDVLCPTFNKKNILVKYFYKDIHVKTDKPSLFNRCKKYTTGEPGDQ